MEIDQNITFKKLVDNLEGLRCEYNRDLRLFKCYEVKERTKYRQEIRNLFYSLNIEYWQKDRVWDYMNFYEEYEVLKEIASRYK